MIFRPEDFLVDGVKKVQLRDVTLTSNSGVSYGLFLQDQTASFFYSATLGGFFPVTEAAIPLLASVIHYGLGAFEGIHHKVGPKGTGLDAPTDNAFRLMYSAEALSQSFLSRLISASLGGKSLSTIPMTAGEVYQLGRSENNPFWGVNARAGTGQGVGKLDFPYTLEVAFAGSASSKLVLDAETLVSIFNAIAFYNKLVSVSHFPEVSTKVEGAYLRPLLYYGNAFSSDSMRHLKIPSVGRTFEFMAMNLPWGNYLKASDYETGLTVLISPFERIGKDMLNGKIVGNYVNSKMSIDIMRHVVNAATGLLKNGSPDTETSQKLEMLASLGEVLVKTRDNTFVEGSAENLFFIVKDTSGYTVYTPPVSDSPLPGTNRARAIETFESMGMRVVYQSFDYETIKNMNKSGRLVGALFTGTGADIIHIKQIVDLPHLRKLVDMTGFASEEVETCSINAPPLLEGMEVIQINNGLRHPIIGKILETHGKRVVENLFVPVYTINFEKLAVAMGGLELKDIAQTRTQMQKCTGDYFKEPFINQKDAVRRYKDCAKLLANAINSQWRHYGLSSKIASEITGRIRTK